MNVFLGDPSEGEMMARDRTSKEQAELDRKAAEALRAANLARERRQEMAEAFVTPRHLRRDVIRALGVSVPMIQNWQARNQIQLDGDDLRDGQEWRLYSSRDVLMLGIAARLSEVGLRASLLQSVLDQVKPVLMTGSPYLAANRTSYIVVLPNGSVIGPELGATLDIGDIPEGRFIVLRLDTLVREALEPLGETMLAGSADDIRNYFAD